MRATVEQIGDMLRGMVDAAGRMWEADYAAMRRAFAEVGCTCGARALPVRVNDRPGVMCLACGAVVMEANAHARDD